MLINSVRNTANNVRRSFYDQFVYLKKGLNVFVHNSAGRRNHIKSLCLLAGAFLFLSLTGCAQNPVTGSQDFVMLSEDSEIAIGRTNHPKIIAEYGRYDDAELQAYVQSVGNKLAVVSHRSNLHYRFTVLDSPVINAFALPGGYIYITRGLMAYLNSEAELAAVLGHEIGHVTARHGVRQQSASQAAGLLYTIGSILVPELRAAASQQVFNIFGGALLSGYGREHELESDGLGAEYLAKAGYDTNAMIDVIRVLKAQETFSAVQAKKQGREAAGYHGLFASHPDNDTRLHEVVAKAEKFSLGDKAVRARLPYLNKIEGMVFGDSEAQGIRSEHHFYHLAMNFTVDFPVNWQILNNPSRLRAISSGGKAFIEVQVSDLNRKLSPREFIMQRLKVDKLIDGRRLNVHGLQGYTGVISQQGELARLSVLYFQNQAFIFFASVEDKKQFNQFDTEFIKTVSSFHALSEEDKKLAHALTIEVVPVKKGDNYARWASKSRISNSALLQLKLLNADYPEGELQSGKLAKRVK